MPRISRSNTPSMTKKNFEAAAELVRVRDGAEAKAAMEAFIELFQADNNRFDVERFKKACVSHRRGGPQNGLGGHRGIELRPASDGHTTGDKWLVSNAEHRRMMADHDARMAKKRADLKCPRGKRRTASGACKRPKRS